MTAARRDTAVAAAVARPLRCERRRSGLPPRDLHAAGAGGARDHVVACSANGRRALIRYGHDQEARSARSRRAHPVSRCAPHTPASCSLWNCSAITACSSSTSRMSSASASTPATGRPDRLEHVLSEALEARIDASLGSPPQIEPIPAGTLRYEAPVCRASPRGDEAPRCAILDGNSEVEARARSAVRGTADGAGRRPTRGDRQRARSSDRRLDLTIPISIAGRRARCSGGEGRHASARRSRKSRAVWIGSRSARSSKCRSPETRTARSCSASASR